MKKEKEELILKVKTAPEKPGVYLFKNEKGKVIYVGKAKSLKKRVGTYFQSQIRNKRVETIRKLINDIEFIVTKTETEALILENNLIKSHDPSMNIKLRDSSTFPFIKITTSEEFPRAEIVRKRVRGRDIYFGPFTDAKTLKISLKQALTIFPIASCKKEIRGKKERPCLLYQLKRCLAPCVGDIKREEYNKVVQQLIKLLEGKQRELIRELKEEMKKLSEKLEFERAAKLRDKIRALEEITQRQRIISQDLEAEYDVLGVANKTTVAAIQMLIMRQGRLIAQKHFIIDLPMEMKDSEIITPFIVQYYTQATDIPKVIVTEATLADEETINKWLKSKRKEKIGKRIIVRPETEELAELMQLANENAELNLMTKERIKTMKEEKIDKGLEELKELLDLETIPNRIEGYDISTLQGTDTVGSCVVFEKGKPKKEDYRKFKIKTVNSQDDFSCITEIIIRRFTGTLTKKEPKPDLILIDGGRGQVSAALAGLKKAKMKIPMIGLAKEFEEIHFPDKREAMRLLERSEALKILQQIRDEAHRFAVSYHRKIRTKKMIESSLERIGGIGKKRMEILLKHFETIEEIKNATVEELEKVEGISRKQAERIVKYYKGIEKKSL